MARRLNNRKVVPVRSGRDIDETVTPCPPECRMGLYRLLVEFGRRSRGVYPGGTTDLQIHLAIALLNMDPEGERARVGSIVYLTGLPRTTVLRRTKVMKERGILTQERRNFYVTTHGLALGWSTMDPLYPLWCRSSEED